MPMLQERHASDPIEDLLAVLAADGGVIVHGMLDADIIESMLADFSAAFTGTAAGTRTGDDAVDLFWGSNTKRFTRLSWRSSTYREHVLVHPLLTSVADALLDRDDYWLNTGQVMAVGPGEDAQYLHRDADNWRALNLPTAPEITVSCMFALTPFTAANGATRVVPGSHLWGDFQRRATVEERTQAVMPAGSGMIYTGRVLHSAAANTTADEWRYGMHTSFVRGWLTPEEASSVGMPPDIARSLTEQQQRLLGYRCYSVPGDARLWTVDYEEIPTALGW